METKVILNDIKNKSFDNKRTALRKPISVSKILSAITESVDWDEVAENCSLNKTHEHFGKDPQEIRKIWLDNGKEGMDRGKMLDRYIQHKRNNYPKLVIDDYPDEVKQCYKAFDKFNDETLSNVSLIGSEVWLTSKKLGVVGRADELDLYVNGDIPIIVVYDWKGNKNISFENPFRKLLGCMEWADDCDIIKFTLQTHIYRYILEEYGYKNVVTRVCNITPNGVETHKEYFEYDANIIEDIVKFAKNKIYGE